MKRWRTTSIVLALFAVLLAYVLLVEVKRDPPPPEDAAPTPVPVLDMALDEVRALRVSDGARTLRVENRGLEWVITEPDEGPADAYEVFMPINDLTGRDWDYWFY